MLAVADRRELGELAAVDEQRHPGVAEAERREPRRARRRGRASSFAPGTIASTRVTRTQVVVGEHRVGVRGERRRERLERARVDRQARGRAMPAEALEVLGARGERRRAGRTPAPSGPTPSRAPSVPAIRTTGPVVPLDEARGDDADHALVPVLARDDVPAAPAARARATTRPRRPPRAGSAPRPPAARGSASRAPRRAASPRRRRSVSSSSSAASGRHSRPDGVDPRREPEADRASSTAAGSTPATRISARSPGFWVWASRRRPASASARFSSTSGTTSATVASATMSRCALEERMVGAEQRLRELPHDAGAAQPGERVVALQRRDDRARRERVGRAGGGP